MKASHANSFRYDHVYDHGFPSAIELFAILQYILQHLHVFPLPLSIQQLVYISPLPSLCFLPSPFLPLLAQLLLLNPAFSSAVIHTPALQHSTTTLPKGTLSAVPNQVPIPIRLFSYQPLSTLPNCCPLSFRSSHSS